MKKFRHLIEAGALYLLFAAFRVLPLDVASWLGSELARTIGPFMRAHKIAKRNLDMIFPDYTASQKRWIIAGMWDNLGRVAAEMPHLPNKKLYARIKVNGMENMTTDGKPVIFFSAHLGNWELTYPMAHQQGIPITLIYRQANNSLTDEIVAKLRATQSSDMLPKGPKGAIKLLRRIKDGHSLAMLVDQKMNEGISVPFFGRPAMTAPGIAEFALRYDMPIIPVRVARTKGCYFDAMVYPQLIYEKTGDKQTDVLTIITLINAIIEGWVREHPEQWFWVHKRWPDATKA